MLPNIDIGEEEYMRGRKKTIQKKLGISKEYIEMSDMESIFEKAHITMNPEHAKKIYEDLDVDNTGRVKMEKFIDALTNYQKSSSYSDILKQINEELMTKSERIILKLKNLRQKATFCDDGQSVEEINWIISALSDDIFELEIDNIFDKSNNYDNNARVWLSQTSNAQSKIERGIDQSFTNKEQKQKTMSFIKSLLMSDKVGAFKTLERKSSIVNLEIDSEKFFSVRENLNHVSEFSYDLFALNDLVGRKSLYFITNEIFHEKNYFDSLVDINKFQNFIKEITSGYDRNITYHNDLHAADVIQSINVMIEKGNMMQSLNLNDVDILAVLLSAACHDFRHNGFNNLFHINDKSAIAVTYNDTSVLENFHVAETFKVMMKDECNLLIKLNPHEWRHIRRRMIDCILATDMANHTKCISNLKTKIETLDIKNGSNIDKLLSDNNSKNYDNQQLLLGMCVHLADISNPAKPFDTYRKWVDLLFVEFFNQGDLEKSKGLPVSLLCDRDTTNIQKSQIGFIQYVVGPSFEVLLNFVPGISPYFEVMKENLKKYEDIAKEIENR